MALICRDTTSIVFPASLSERSSPIQAITFKPSARAWKTFSPTNWKKGARENLRESENVCESK